MADSAEGTPIGDGYRQHMAALEATVRARSVDQVARMGRIMAANPGLMITSPKQNGTGHYVADWTTEDEVTGRVHHWELRKLLDELTGKHGFADA